MWTNFYPHYIHQDLPRKPSPACRHFFCWTRTSSRDCSLGHLYQEPSASECLATATGSLTRLTNRQARSSHPSGCELSSTGANARCSSRLFFAKVHAHSNIPEGPSSFFPIPEPPPKTPACNGVDLAAFLVSTAIEWDDQPYANWALFGGAGHIFAVGAQTTENSSNGRGR